MEDDFDVYLPTTCPACDSQLEWVGVDLKCNNPNCKGADLLDLRRWCEIIGETDGFAWLLMKQYLDIFDIKSIAELYQKQANTNTFFTTRALSITDVKAYEFFDKLYKRPVDIEKALLGLNIPRLGDKTVKLLAKEKDLILGYYNYLQDYSQGIYGDITLYHNKFLEVVKDATTLSIKENSVKFLNLQYIIKDARIKFKEDTNREVIKVAVTGSLETMKRSAFEKYIESYGYELSSSIKSCKYLITDRKSVV